MPHPRTEPVDPLMAHPVSLTSVSNDAFKGMAIFLIVFGHNKSLEYAHPEFRAFLYLFHVAMFLYLPFLRPWETWGRARHMDVVVRYGWPCIIFTFAYTLMFVVFSGRDVGQVPVLAGGAVLAMSARAFDHATGLQLLWFLPALIGIRFAMSAAARFKASHIWGVIVIAAVSHGLIGMLPNGYKYITPFGWPVAAFVLLPGLLIALLRPDTRRISWWLLAPLIAVAGVLMFSTGLINRGHPLNIGMVNVPSAAEPLKLIALDLVQLSALLVLFALSKLAAIQMVFSRLGKISLEVFLLHQPIYIAIATKFPVAQAAILGPWLTGSLTLALTLLSSVAIAMAIRNLPSLHGFLFPAGADALRRVWKPRVEA
jgi:fucose 4-O-acetylase-like acetyltransferase